MEMEKGGGGKRKEMTIKRAKKWNRIKQILNCDRRENPTTKKKKKMEKREQQKEEQQLHGNWRRRTETNEFGAEFDGSNTTDKQQELKHTPLPLKTKWLEIERAPVSNWQQKLFAEKQKKNSDEKLDWETKGNRHKRSKTKGIKQNGEDVIIWIREKFDQSLGSPDKTSFIERTQEWLVQTSFFQKLWLGRHQVWKTRTKCRFCLNDLLKKTQIV